MLFPTSLNFQFSAGRVGNMLNACIAIVAEEYFQYDEQLLDMATWLLVPEVIRLVSIRTIS